MLDAVLVTEESFDVGQCGEIKEFNGSVERGGIEFESPLAE